MQALHELTEMATKLNIQPESLVRFPDDVRANVEHLIRANLTEHETTWMRSIIEPFHPMSNGARVPSNTPKETVSYTHFTTMPCDSDSIFIANYEM